MSANNLQPDLFVGTPYVRGSETSRAAAERIAPNANTLRAAVYAFLVRCERHGATDEEVCDALGMGGSTERPRRVELVDGGFVVDSGRQRQTRSGRRAVVWMTKGCVAT